ncbi:MAG: hypothetical protein JNJ69_14755 [Leptospiraceae bacterium]|nr:hypothetical protein [Leptospiraceae bacterium]
MAAIGSGTAEAAIGNKITYGRSEAQTDGIENLHGPFFHKASETNAAIMTEALQDCFSSQKAIILNPLVESAVDFPANYLIQGNPAYCLAISQLKQGNRGAALFLSGILLKMRPHNLQGRVLYMRMNFTREQYLHQAETERFDGVDPATSRWLFAEAALFDGDGESAERILKPLIPYFPELIHRASLIRTKMAF